jgi:hypothetical protein
VGRSAGQETRARIRFDATHPRIHADRADVAGRDVRHEPIEPLLEPARGRRVMLNQRAANRTIVKFAEMRQRHE